jgi:hypothetical protein
VDLFVPRLTSLLDVPLLVLEGVDTFLFDDFWCPPLIVCREELLGLVEACLEDDCLEVVAFLLDALLLDAPLFELALLEGALARLADAPPREALCRMRWAKQSSGITRTRVKRKIKAVMSFLKDR